MIKVVPGGLWKELIKVLTEIRIELIKIEEAIRDSAKTGGAK